MTPKTRNQDLLHAKGAACRLRIPDRICKVMCPHAIHQQRRHTRNRRLSARRRALIPGHAPLSYRFADGQNAQAICLAPHLKDTTCHPALGIHAWSQASPAYAALGASSSLRRLCGPVRPEPALLACLCLSGSFRCTSGSDGVGCLASGRNVCGKTRRQAISCHRHNGSLGQKAGHCLLARLHSFRAAIKQKDPFPPAAPHLRGLTGCAFLPGLAWISLSIPFPVINCYCSDSIYSGPDMAQDHEQL